MRQGRWLWVGLVLPAALAAYAWLPARTPAPARVIDFQQYRFGLPPAEFDFEATGPHGPVLSAGRPLWRTYVDLFAPSPKLVLLQASTLPRPDHYPLALLRGFTARDLMLFAYLKPLGGEAHQRAGLLWRARDKDHYYAVLADARADRLELLKMVGGTPHTLASAPAAIDIEFERRGSPGPTHGWYTLRVEAVGDRIGVWFQGEKAIDARDGTFAGEGRAGLVSHGDTVAAWDDLHVQAGRRFVVPTPRPPPPPSPPPVMHVTEVVATDASFRGPADAFTDQAFWRVGVADGQGRPVLGVLVETELLRPDGSLRARRRVMTGTDGTVFFAEPLRPSDPDGLYTVRVSGLAHADRPDAVYDPAANLVSSVSFPAMPSGARARAGAPPRSEGDRARSRSVP